ncbi:MAG: hypothetical protein ACKV22_33970 [Bryobacteraceae bacterium]
MSPAIVPKVLVLALMMYAAYELVRNPVRFIRAINSASEAVYQLRSFLFQQAGPLFEPQTLPESSGMVRLIRAAGAAVASIALMYLTGVIPA